MPRQRRYIIQKRALLQRSRAAKAKKRAETLMDIKNVKKVKAIKIKLPKVLVEKPKRESLCSKEKLEHMQKLQEIQSEIRKRNKEKKEKRREFMKKLHERKKYKRILAQVSSFIDENVASSSSTNQNAFFPKVSVKKEFIDEYSAVEKPKIVTKTEPEENILKAFYKLINNNQSTPSLPSVTIKKEFA